MSQLGIVAIFTIKPQFSAEFVVEVKKLVEGSRQENGCIQYDFNQDINDPNTYIFTEKWQSKQAIEQHNAEPHYKEFAKYVEGKVDKKVVHIMTQII